MISFDSRDGRKILGLGLQMELPELEEGEALSYNREAQDSTIDPDISLSYIEEKLQNVLGHFQKDFEGGISAENLGAKFGGYGSFLPTYQRSPSWSHTKSSAEALYNHDSPKSPKKLYVEDQRQKSLASSSASPMGRSLIASGKAAPPESFLIGNNSSFQSGHAEESSLRRGGVKKYVNYSDQRTLKLRIKVGSENLSTQKNAEIYSGLGLEVSPSSSFDDGPTTREGQFGKLTEVPEASPSDILQIMTTLPDEMILSPLSESLICLTEKKKPRGKFENKTVNKTSAESFGSSENGSLSSKCNQKKSKLSEKGDVFPMDLTNQKINGNMDHNKGFLLKKEKKTEVDTLDCEKLVSNALTHPLYSGSQTNFLDPATLKHGVKVETLSAFTENNNLDNKSAQAIGGVENSSRKMNALSKTSEFKRGNLVSKACPSVDHTESIVCEGRKLEEGLKPALVKSSTGGKEKYKVATVTHGASSSINDLCDLPNGHEKPRDRYKDFFGDVEFEDEDNESISGEVKSPRGLKSPKVVGKRSSSADPNMSKEKFDINISQKQPQVPEYYPRPAFQSAPPSGNGLSSEALAGSVPFVKEDWVSCDKCQKWRLLPLGTNISSLPDKWLCRMLTWLPGMNRCSIPQEETTNALRALYRPAASILGLTTQAQHSQPNNSPVNSMQMPMADAKYPGQNNQNHASQTLTLSGKKKHGSVKAAYSNELNGSSNSSNSHKKGRGTSNKTSNLNNRNNSPSRQSVFAVEKCSDHKKERPSFSNSSDRGPKLKIKSKQEADMEGSRASKRIKSEELHVNGDYGTFDNGGSSTKAGRPFITFSNNTSGKNKLKYESQTDLTGAKKDMIPGTNAETHISSSSFSCLLFQEKCDEKDSIRKRKAKKQSDQRIEKKARVKSGGKDSNGSKATIETDRSWSHKDDHIEQFPRNIVADFSKSDIGPVNPTLAANSSSSMVSGWCKNRTTGREVKSSPVESVSSSPLRYPNTDKVKSSKNKEMKRDGELSGEDERGMVKKEEVLNISNPVTNIPADKYASVKYSSDQCMVEEQANIDQLPKKKPGKGLSPHSKDKAHATGSDFDKVKKSSLDSLRREYVYEERSKSMKNKSDEKFGIPRKGEKCNGKNENTGRTPSESCKEQKFGNDEKDISKRHDKKHNIHQGQANEKLSKRSNQAEANGNGKSHSLPPLARSSSEHVSGTHIENGVKISAHDLDYDKGQKTRNQKMKGENLNGHQPMWHSTPNSHKIRDIDAPSPLRRDSSSHAANSALKEAKNLKHLADRLKNNGSTESNGFYFQAALKFLRGASLLETGSGESKKHNDLMHSMHIYSSTAKLCEFCAHEYEKSKDMAAASLSYKCSEIAYLRVVYSSHNNASRDQNELQTALQFVPPGESPSSSASDIDNLNNQITTDKAVLAKAIGSPQACGSHIISSRNRSGFLRMLNFAQDVNFAMEASRKARIAFTAATAKLCEFLNKEGLDSVKKALDFNFQDIEELLRLVRLAMEAINR